MDPFHLYQVWVAVDIIWFHHFKKTQREMGNDSESWRTVLCSVFLQFLNTFSKSGARVF